MVYYRPVDDTYQVEYGKPRMFNFYWDEYNKEEDFIFHFLFKIHSVNKDKDIKKNYYYYSDDFSPAVANFIYKIVSP